MADARYRRERELKQNAGNRFLDSYLAQEREAATRLVESQPGPAVTSGAAFDFQGRLKGSGQASRRRCASCLGSGKAGYVTGSRFESTATGQEVAAPSCSACNGTGWR
ncbi:hypothetical protein ESB00_05525 [Oleiharenicola lentus]|uniref:Uncharacterized protein n=1 Tax=Oleiharenicola lentus TaxID=2508720 RepID=A0A4Q1C8W0_9BACT|nr:hypothetical protein [Oleiharenicola lentus]RXK55358.1 hypothetical protein ESB00_05525 [Oleiharenicola lentus]